MSLIIERFQSSELSRNAPAVFRAAEASPVLVTRRDGQSLVLMTEREADSLHQLFEVVNPIFAAATGTEGTLLDRMCDRFPWILSLSEQGRQECVTELVRATRLSMSTGQAHYAVIEFMAWQDSAFAIAAGLNHDKVDWLDEPIPVERPA